MLTLFLAFIDDEEEKNLFISLYEQHRYTLLRYAALVLTQDYQDYAEDIVEDAFLAVAKHMKTISKIDCGKRRSFIVTIVRNKAIDFLRKSSRNPVESIDDIEFELQTDTLAPLEVVITKEGYAQLKQYVNQLSDTYRTPLEMSLFYQLSNPEIGEMLGLTPKTVSARISRGKEKLKEMIIKKGE